MTNCLWLTGCYDGGVTSFPGCDALRLPRPGGAFFAYPVLRISAMSSGSTVIPAVRAASTNASRAVSAST